MKTAKIGAIFLVSVMALAAIGAAYAHWEETLTISGVMTTDNIDPGFYCPDSNDDIGEGPDSMDPAGCGEWTNKKWDENNVVGRREKNVGWTTVKDKEDHNLLEIVVGDAYPCYYTHPFFCIENYGSCPVHLKEVVLTKLSFQWLDPTGMWIDEEWDVDIDLSVCTYYFIDVIKKADGSYKVKVVENDWANRAKYDFFIHPTGDITVCTQLDPYGWTKGDGHLDPAVTPTTILYGDLCIHFENGCRQLATYDFTIGLLFYNWPE